MDCKRAAQRKKGTELHDCEISAGVSAQRSRSRPTMGACAVYTPTGNGFVWDSVLSATPENRPCNRDIS
ncbi:MAG TPA: hypothetical protein VN901_25445, partial [Candidatus Acidoferrales bacterium]|nr:hypothetical protein [Candidatus Acidoferrales bacterium]